MSLKSKVFGWMFVLIIPTALLSSVSCAPSPEKLPEYLCNAENKCPQNQICVEGLCSKKNPESRRVAVRVNPVSDSQFSTQFLPVDWLNFKRPLNIAITPNITVRGTVTQGDNTSIANAKLVFSPVDKSRNAEVQIDVSSNGTYQANLFPAKYEITIIPQSNDIPPYHWSERELTANSVLNLSMPPPSEIRTVTFSTNLPPGTFFGNRSPELLSARIYAYSDADAHQISTFSTIRPDADEATNPTASLRMYASTDPYSVRVEPNTFSSLVPIRTFARAFKCETTCRSLLPADGGAQTVSLSFDLDIRNAVNVRLKLVPPASLSGEPLAELKLVLTRTYKGETSEVRVTVDDQGVAVPQIVPGEYTVTVESPPTSRVQSKVYPNVQLNDHTTATIDLEPKLNATGFVTDSYDKPIADSRIEFRKIINGIVQTQPHIDTTQANGSFNTWLDPASYIISIIPNLPSLPRYTSKFSPFHDNAKTWVVGEPTVLHGRVFELPSGNSTTKVVGIPRVNLEFLEPFGLNMVVISSTVTNDDGTFRTVISDLSKF